MEWWQVALLAFGTATIVLAVAGLVLWRTASSRTKALAGRINRLSWRAKLRMARDLVADDRIPILVRAIPPALVLYLALPLDIVPDFIPVLGQLDDVVVVAVGVALLIRFTPLEVLDAHLTALESVDRAR